jgi:hypothetical protein
MDYWMSFSFHIFPDYYFKMSVVVAQQKINGRPNQFYGDGRHSFILKLPVLEIATYLLKALALKRSFGPATTPQQPEVDSLALYAKQMQTIIDLKKLHPPELMGCKSSYHSSIWLLFKMH